MSTPWTVDELVGLLRRHGFVPCDIPACNCGSWHHRDGLAARWRELEEILEPGNGELMCSAARRHVAAVADLRAALPRASEAMNEPLCQGDDDPLQCPEAPCTYCVPWLHAEVERLQAQNDALRTALRAAADDLEHESVRTGSDPALNETLKRYRDLADPPA